MRRRKMVAAAAMLAWPRVSHGLETAVRAQLLGGQYFYAGQKGALSGNAALTLAPATRLTDTFTLVPVLSSSYQGTKQAVDLVGAGTIVQEQMEHRVAARGIWEPKDSRWKLKPSAGYTYTLAKETRDESWGRGLFDSWRLGLGLDAEYPARDGLAFRLGADYYYTTYPNFSSLESQAGVDPSGQPLARELAGKKTMDHHTQGVGAGATLIKGRFVLDGRLREQRSFFADQRVVDGTGILSDASREDWLTSLSGSIGMPSELNTDRRLLGHADLSVAFNRSNQASFDARRARYLPGYYDYSDVRLGVGARRLFGDPREPVTLSAGLSFARRTYPHRPPQEATGVYRGGTLSQDVRTLSLGADYPLAPAFKLLFRLDHARSSSNQDYEQVYAYNYTVTNFLFGIAYDY
ncbi:MAG: hypothetical protein HY925_13940 [Elusimicrobia bacterium]|nr:hypothetical protein [Elusimicrobiota bacterium]